MLLWYEENTSFPIAFPSYTARTFPVYLQDDFGVLLKVITSEFMLLIDFITFNV